MIAESRQLITAYQKYFKRTFNYQYWLVIVNNHFDHCYAIFLYTRKVHTQLLRSYELVHFSNQDQALYQQVLADLKKTSRLSIEFRDTRHLIHPGTDIVQDTVHGHGSHANYHVQSQKKWIRTSIVD